MIQTQKEIKPVFQKVIDGVEWVGGRVKKLPILHGWDDPTVLARLPADCMTFIAAGAMADRMLVAAPPAVRVLGSMAAAVVGVVVIDAGLQTQAPNKQKSGEKQE